MTTKTETRIFVDCFTTRAETSAKIRKSRVWGKRTEMPCPFCRSHPTTGSWMEHILAKHAPVEDISQRAWLTAFNFGEVRTARNCTNGSLTNRAA
jgi:hypothetical protein